MSYQQSSFVGLAYPSSLHQGTHQQDDHPASQKAAAAVAAMTPWTEADERRYQRAKLLTWSKKRRQILKNDRAAQRLGFPTNAVVMSLPYNTVCPSSQDARSFTQRSEERDDGNNDEAAGDGNKEVTELQKSFTRELKILPKCLWSMGKSFHSGKRDDYFIELERQHCLQFPAGDRRLARKLPRSPFGTNGRPSYGLIAWSLPLPFILGTQSGRWRQDKFLALAFFLGCPIIDRTDTLNHHMGISLINLHPIPRKQVTYFKTLETVMLERAQEALDLCRERRNQKIHLLWSGGIDTTAIICAFVRVTQGNDEARQRIVVRYAERSISEYPAFFHQVISKMFHHEEILGHVRDAFTVDKSEWESGDIPLVVTGDPADMLFGTFRMAGALMEDEAYSLKEPWQDRVPKLLNKRRLLLNHNEYFTSDGRRKTITRSQVKAAGLEWIKWITPQVRKSPIPVVTMFDWWWWITYSCKYDHDVHRIFYNREEIPSYLRNRVFNFYQSDEFHQYSFANHDKKMKDLRVWASYKHPLKEFIFSFCKDQGLVDKKAGPTAAVGCNFGAASRTAPCSSLMSGSMDNGNVMILNHSKKGVPHANRASTGTIRQGYQSYNPNADRLRTVSEQMAWQCEDEDEEYDGYKGPSGAEYNKKAEVPLSPVKSNEDQEDCSLPPAPHSVNDHLVYFLSKIKVPSVANSFGMEVGIDSNWNVIKFGAASISIRHFNDEFLEANRNKLTSALFLPSGQHKYDADRRWIYGDYSRAIASYQMAHTHGLNCEADIKSCEGAIKRSRLGKTPRVEPSKDLLQKRQVRALATHLSWRDEGRMPNPQLWAYAQGGAGE